MQTLSDPKLCMQSRISSLASLIGNTPLIALHISWKGQRRIIYAKAEYFNLTGSIKDRMALKIFEEGIRSGQIKPGDTIVEATSGSSGISLASFARALGNPVRIYMPSTASDERKAMLRSFGADLNLVEPSCGGIASALDAALNYAESCEDTFLPDQFANEANARAHENTTGPEIVRQLASVGRKPDAFVAGVGTGGTIMGVSRALRKANSRLQSYAIDPAGSKGGKHRVQGLNTEFVPALFNPKETNGTLTVSDGDAIIMAQRLASQLGLAVGISSGANVVGALLAQDELGPEATVVTVLCDDNKKYLSTDLARTEPIKPS
ncbi:MAG: cysteine synthase family protein, partial [Pseudomonadota bacterium]